MPANTLTQESLWCALYELGNELGDSDVSAEVAAELVAFKIAERCDGRSLRLTPYREKCFVVLEAGDGSVPENVQPFLTGALRERGVHRVATA
jgi:hypothetical protein